jgi:hypothetical protein
MEPNALTQAEVPGSHEQVTSLSQALDACAQQFKDLRELCYLKDKLIAELARWIEYAYTSTQPSSPALLLAKAHAHTAMAELKADYQTPAPQYPQPSPEDLASQLLDCVDDFIGGLGSNEAQKLKARFIRILNPAAMPNLYPNPQAQLQSQSLKPTP